MVYKQKKDMFLGDKIRAGRLLSEALRKIAQEQTELIEDPDLGDRMGTKAEALARTLWKMALGYTEQVGEKEIKHPPDKAAAVLLFERIEGKAGPAEDGVKRPTAAQKVSALSKDKINRLSENAAK